MSYTAFQDMVDEYGDLDDEEEILALESYWVADFGVVSPNVEARLIKRFWLRVRKSTRCPVLIAILGLNGPLQDMLRPRFSAPLLWLWIRSEAPKSCGIFI